MRFKGPLAPNRSTFERSSFLLLKNLTLKNHGKCENVVIHEGDLATLKHHQKEVDEVKEGTECGMSLANYEDIKEGDLIECFEIKTEIPTIK